MDEIIKSDLISREKLNADMYKACFIENNYFNRGMQKWESGNWIRYKVFEEILAKQPSIEKTGNWLKSAEIRIRAFRCSNCGWIIDIDTISEKPFWNYCPHCGARMEQ